MAFGQWIRTVFVDCDLAIFVINLLLTGLATLYFGRIESRNIRPFFLYDASVWYAYKSVDSVPIWTVFVIGFIFVAAFIYSFEYRHGCQQLHLPCPVAWRNALHFALSVWSCAMTAVMLVEFAKSYVGRLRPNFAARCLGPAAAPPSPDMLAAHGAAAMSTCGDTGDAWDGRRSFPSGHAALAAAIAVFTQLWMLRMGDAVRADHPRRAHGEVGGGGDGCEEAGGLAGLAWYFAGVAMLAWGGWVGASRVVDNAHHVSDVVGGACIGAWCAVAQFWRVERITRKRTERVLLQGKGGVCAEEPAGVKTA